MRIPLIPYVRYGGTIQLYLALDSPVENQEQSNTQRTRCLHRIFNREGIKCKVQYSIHPYSVHPYIFACVMCHVSCVMCDLGLLVPLVSKG